MIEINISPAMQQAFPNLRIGVIEAQVINSETSDMLWNELQEEVDRINNLYLTTTLTQRPAIAATRKAYKTLGKDPARYRVSSEALCRRCLRGLDLYRINTLVDLINIVSMRSGYSIGGFDADRIEGNSLTLGIGRPDELFYGIGRGPLNIDGLPVYRDTVGGVGTPTSDEERTKLTIETTHLLICINAYATEMPLQECMDYTEHLLTRYASASYLTKRVVGEE